MIKVKNTIFLGVVRVGTDDFQRIVIRDDRKEMQDYIERNVLIGAPSIRIESVAEYTFKTKVTKYYTVEKFMLKVE